jgi:hypothetical protein
MDVVSSANGRDTEPLVWPGVACVHCGYDVRGLRTRGHCPECGHEIAQSVRWAQLRWREAPPLSASDPRWVREVSLGPLMAVASFVIAVGFALWPAGPYGWVPAERVVGLTLAFTAWTLSCWAAWKLSEPEPLRPPAGMSGPRARRVLRWGTCAYFTVPVAFSVVSLLDLERVAIVPMLASLLGGIVAAGACVSSARDISPNAPIRANCAWRRTCSPSST